MRKLTFYIFYNYFPWDSKIRMVPFDMEAERMSPVTVFDIMNVLAAS